MTIVGRFTKPSVNEPTPRVLFSLGKFQVVTSVACKKPSQIAKEGCNSAFTNFKASPNVDTYRILRQNCEAFMNAFTDEKQEKVGK